MNRKCKKTGIFIGLTMAITGMTACGEKDDGGALHRGE